MILTSSRTGSITVDSWFGIIFGYTYIVLLRPLYTENKKGLAERAFIPATIYISVVLSF
jgi:hypothetical protein